jgi:hypothetical protein
MNAIAKVRDLSFRKRSSSAQMVASAVALHLRLQVGELQQHLSAEIKTH